MKKVKITFPTHSGYDKYLGCITIKNCQFYKDNLTIIATLNRDEIDIAENISGAKVEPVETIR